MFLESTDARRPETSVSPDDASPSPLPALGPHLLLGHWLCSRQACLRVVSSRIVSF